MAGRRTAPCLCFRRYAYEFAAGDLLKVLGPTPPQKFPTVIDRLNKSRIENSLLFFRTSAVGRQATRFLSDLRILPPFADVACIAAVQALSSRGVELHFADDEADAFAVELAARVDGYVLGQDSDFVILQQDGYKGYIPLDEMAWSYPEVDEPALNSDFTQFMPPKSRLRKKSILTPHGRGLIPADGYQYLNISIYQPEALAVHLKLPPPLLPLLGAFVGNDLSSFARQFFDKNLSLSQRIVRVADALRRFVGNAPGSHHRKKYPATVIELVESMMSALALYPLPSGEHALMLNSIVESILHYGIPPGLGPLWPSCQCVLHAPDVCPLLQVLKKAPRDDQQHLFLARYLQQYREGKMLPDILNILYSGTFWPTIFLENPDMQSVHVSISRPIRLWMYAVLDSTVGIFSNSHAGSKVGVTESTGTPVGRAASSVSEAAADVESWGIDEAQSPSSTGVAKHSCCDSLTIVRLNVHIAQSTVFEQLADRTTRCQRVLSTRRSRQFPRHCHPATGTAFEHGGLVGCNRSLNTDSGQP